MIDVHRLSCGFNRFGQKVGSDILGVNTGNEKPACFDWGIRKLRNLRNPFVEVAVKRGIEIWTRRDISLVFDSWALSNECSTSLPN